MHKRTISLFGATMIGIGAIVGGGILALAGAAYSITGPSAVLAFALNGGIALITALSFSEMASTFPESGGTYTFSKKVLTVQAAFSVGWVVWFASIVAATLYALGFASFFAISLHAILLNLLDVDAQWILRKWVLAIFAILGTFYFMNNQVRQKSSTGNLSNITKMSVFAILIMAGAWALATQDVEVTIKNVQPFFANGAPGLFQAMGYTFIALQGFDLIAAVGGEIKKPEVNIPKAMIFSLSAALAIYLPLLFLFPAVGTIPGSSIFEMASANPDGVVAIAVQQYLGPVGFALVMVAGVFSMLSALQANLYASSRVAFSMAKDRTLPKALASIHQTFGSPSKSIMVSAGTIIILILALPDVASAGAASSLIFLISFAIAHGICILARLRSEGNSNAFQVPLFPYLPAIGAFLCVILAVYQGISVPSAGIIAALWLGLGGFLYWFLLASRAEIYDASAEASNPELLKLRGRSPLVLVPISNPASVPSLLGVAQAMAPLSVGRVLLLSVVKAPRLWTRSYENELEQASTVLKAAISNAYSSGLTPEALTTVSPDPGEEIVRVAHLHRCETVLLGLSQIENDKVDERFQRLLHEVQGQIVILKAPAGWNLSQVKKILVPAAGKSVNGTLRARLLSSVARLTDPDIRFLQVVGKSVSEKVRQKLLNELYEVALDEAANPSKLSVEVNRAESISDELINEARDADLVVMGLPIVNQKKRIFGDLAIDMAQKSETPLLIIGR